MTIGENIKKIRKEKRLTQKELAQRLNVSQANLAQYENGKRNPKLATLQKIADALEVSVSDLLSSSCTQESKQPTTLAAHFDGEEYTEEEMEEIKQFAKFVKSKRKNN